MAKECKWCGSATHYAFQCFKNPKRTKYKPVKPSHIKQYGPTAFAYQKVRRAWFAQNEPNHQGYYICYICKKWLTPRETELDHIKSRSRYPELRFELSNLAPCCHDCNQKKGSTDLDINPE